MCFKHVFEYVFFVKIYSRVCSQTDRKKVSNKVSDRVLVALPSPQFHHSKEKVSFSEFFLTLLNFNPNSAEIASLDNTNTDYPISAEIVSPDNTNTDYPNNAEIASPDNTNTDYPNNAELASPDNTNTDYPNNAELASPDFLLNWEFSSPYWDPLRKGISPAFFDMHERLVAHREEEAREEAREELIRVARAAAARTKWIDDMVRTWTVSEIALVTRAVESKAERYRSQLEEQAGIPTSVLGRRVSF